jgi:Lipocalin-like domain
MKRRGPPASPVGTWRFLSYVRTDPTTGENTNIFGEHLRGWLIYTLEGRMMVIVVPASSTLPARPLPMTGSLRPDRFA